MVQSFSDQPLCWSYANPTGIIFPVILLDLITVNTDFEFRQSLISPVEPHNRQSYGESV